MVKTKKVNKSLSDLLFKLTESEKSGLVEIPEYWHVLEDTTSRVSCSCGNIVGVTYFPYAFDGENQEICYIGICPICGDFIYVRD